MVLESFSFFSAKHDEDYNHMFEAQEIRFSEVCGYVCERVLCVLEYR